MCHFFIFYKTDSHQLTRTKFVAFGNELSFFDSIECLKYRVPRDVCSLKKKERKKDTKRKKEKKSEVRAPRVKSPNGEAGPSFASLSYAKNVLAPRAFHRHKNSRERLERLVGTPWRILSLSCGTLRITRQLFLANPARLASYCVS